MKKKKEIIELVLENCDVIQFDAEDVYVRFDIVKCSIWKGSKNIGIKNVYINIDKNAKANVLDFPNENWQERLKIPDITHICFGGEDYSVMEYEGGYENKLQRLTETDREIIIEISKKRRKK